LSRYPIIKSREMRIYNRGGIVATIETRDGVLSVASYHPHPGRYPENKALDFGQLVEGLTGSVIVCGDLNCISRDDDIDRTHLIEAFRSFSTNAEAVVDQFLESGKRVFSALGRLGFNDAVPHCGRRYSIPTDLINRDKSSAMQRSTESKLDEMARRPGRELGLTPQEGGVHFNRPLEDDCELVPFLGGDLA
jgi:hypothetical protein